jgi:hypothetical protein
MTRQSPLVKAANADINVDLRVRPIPNSDVSMKDWNLDLVSKLDADRLSFRVSLDTRATEFLADP